MQSLAPTRTFATTTRRLLIRWAGVVALVAVGATATLRDESPASSTGPPSPGPHPGAARPAPRTNDMPLAAMAAPPRAEPRGELVLGEADGAVPDGATAFDDGIAGIAKLDPALRGALRRAAADAARDGITIVVDSGWRSRSYQEHLLRKATAQYGSPQEAARWVASPDASAHVSGDAVDVGPAAARRWLGARGAAYGLCRIYDNEPWHFERRPAATAAGCPATFADPTHDPRLQP